MYVAGRQKRGAGAGGFSWHPEGVILSLDLLQHRDGYLSLPMCSGYTEETGIVKCEYYIMHVKND